MQFQLEFIEQLNTWVFFWLFSLFSSELFSLMNMCIPFFFLYHKISSYHPSLNKTVSCSSDEEDCRQTDDFFVKTILYRLNWRVSKNFCKILIIFFYIFGRSFVLPVEVVKQCEQGFSCV